jgi:hypothetical protein
MAERGRDPLRVLSIDGGGIRGLIPARVLVELETLAQRPVHELFDVIVGTSTGGILALGLVRPDAAVAGRPALSSRALLDLYRHEGASIFPVSRATVLARRVGIHRALPSLRAIAGPRAPGKGNARYSADGLEELLRRYTGDACLGDALTHVMVTSYDVAARRPALLRADGETASLSMLDAARATSAAPTYFPPARPRIGGRDTVLVDGALVANNPALLGFLEATRLDGEAGRPVTVVSLGTGVSEHASTYDQYRVMSWPRVWAESFSMLLDGSSDSVDEMLGSILNLDPRTTRYWRFQTEIGHDRAALDDASTENLAALERVADRLVFEQRAVLAEVVEHLDR